MYLAKLLMCLLKSSKHNSAIRDELTSEVSGLINGVDGFLDFFLDDVIVCCLWFSLFSDVYFLLDFSIIKFAGLDI